MSVINNAKARHHPGDDLDKAIVSGLNAAYQKKRRIAFKNAAAVIVMIGTAALLTLIFLFGEHYLGVKTSIITMSAVAVLAMLAVSVLLFSAAFEDD